ncbi:MAG: hypothetical protein IAE82_19860 [Opitutaceae bacterium]|nr:hypothetical protein [Opitutaceae bacterium]
MENRPSEPAPAAREKKPWPMKWIVLAIVVYIAGYTFINVAYRKPPGAAHEPAVEARERALRTVQTTMNGWSRVTCQLAAGSPMAEAEPAEVATAPLPQPLDRHLPPDLPMIMPGEPALHPGAITVTAPARVAAADGLRVRLEFPGGATVPAFGETLAYFKGNHLYLFLQDKRHVAPDSQPVPAASPLVLVLPPATLTAGTWQASVFTASQTFEWTFTVE